MKRILSTKQLTKQELIHAQSLTLSVQCVEVIRIETIPFIIPSTEYFDSVVFTSANALKHFLSQELTIELLKQKTIFSISGKTKQILAEQGLKALSTADEGKQIAAIICQSDAKSVLHPSSEIKLNDLELGLRKSNINYIPLPVYKVFSQEVNLESDDYDALLFFSPSGVDSFLKKNTIPEKTICCCIGATTAAYLQSLKVNNRIVYPQTPNASAMLNLVASTATQPKD